MALFAKELGDGGVPIVFLHGFGASHAAWKAIQQDLARERYTLAYDLPGHGRSGDYPDAGPAKVAAQAVLADLSERGLSRFHVAGHSMGGTVAALMAMLDPGRVASLTLLSPGGFGPQINHRLLRRYAEAADESALVHCLEAMTGWYSAISREMLATTLATRASPAANARLVAIAAGLVRNGVQGQVPLDRLASLEIPVSVVWGGLDNVLPHRQVHALPPSFAVHHFPDLGHMLPEEAPAEMSAIIGRVAGAGR